MTSVCAVVGGQFGSEGKGLIVGHIAGQYRHHVRVGAANAGHTLYDADGYKRVMQQLPCAAYANPNAALYIGPGALISPDIFEEELDSWYAWRMAKGYPAKPLLVDARAHVIQQWQVDREQESGLAERIGSTSTIAKEGIGAAQAARVMRHEECVTAEQYFTRPGYVDNRIVLCDLPALLHKASGGILLEGTQGTGLSLTTGPFPYVTSRNTTVAGLCADAGVAPSHVDRRILVARTYPIRVAGNSGPFWHDSREIKWEDIGVDPESERTTVTKKIRRVATFSAAQLEEAIVLNHPTDIALTFADYLSPRLAGVEDKDELDTDADEVLLRLVDGITRDLGADVTMLGTGPKTVIEL